LFKLVGHATLADFKVDLAEEFSHDPATAAKGTRDLNRDGRYFGLADVVAGNPATVTERLRAGRYYLMDLGNVGNGTPNPSFTTFRVRASDRHDDGRDADQGDARSRQRVITMTAAILSKRPGCCRREELSQSGIMGTRSTSCRSHP